MASTSSTSASTAALLLLSLSLSVAAKAADEINEITPECQSQWLPLHTGNYWVYRVDSRSATGRHDTHRVLGPYELEGQVWCQIEASFTNYLLRVDADGRILQRFFSSPIEQVLLDPGALKPYPITSPLGFNASAIDYLKRLVLSTNTSTFVRGVGRSFTRMEQLGGSSGGFSSSETLVEASINGKLYRIAEAAQPSVDLNLAERFRNCAMPCYYVACGLGSPVDPPGANKPCLEARIAASSLNFNSNLVLSITSSQGQLRYEQIIPTSNSQPVLYHSLPFYDQRSIGSPITLFPPGDYFITLTALDPSGKPRASTTRALMLN